MNKSGLQKEERTPLWLMALIGLAVLSVLAVMLVFFFGSSSV